MIGSGETIVTVYGRAGMNDGWSSVWTMDEIDSEVQMADDFDRGRMVVRRTDLLSVYGVQTYKIGSDLTHNCQELALIPL